MVSTPRARARRLAPRVALILETLTWLLPPVVLSAFSLYAGTPGTGSLLALVAVAAAVFVPWTFRARFTAAKTERDPADTGIHGARLQGRLLFGLLQLLWAALFLPLSAPLWLWGLILIIAFLAVPALAGARSLNIAPGALVFLLAMLAMPAGIVPGGKATGGAWALLTGVNVWAVSDHVAGIALAVILLPVLLRPGRTLAGVLLFIAFAGLTAYLTDGFRDPASLARGLVFAALLVFAPGRPLRAGVGRLLYYGVAGVTLAVLLLVPTFAAAKNFTRALLPSILAAELLTPVLLFPWNAGASRDS